MTYVILFAVYTANLLSFVVTALKTGAIAGLQEIHNGKVCISRGTRSYYYLTDLAPAMSFIPERISEDNLVFTESTGDSMKILTRQDGYEALCTELDDDECECNVAVGDNIFMELLMAKKDKVTVTPQVKAVSEDKALSKFETAKKQRNGLEHILRTYLDNPTSGISEAEVDSILADDKAQMLMCQVFAPIGAGFDHANLGWAVGGSNRSWLRNLDLRIVEGWSKATIMEKANKIREKPAQCNVSNSGEASTIKFSQLYALFAIAVGTILGLVVFEGLCRCQCMASTVHMEYDHRPKKDTEGVVGYKTMREVRKCCCMGKGIRDDKTCGAKCGECMYGVQRFCRGWLRCYYGRLVTCPNFFWFESRWVFPCPRWVARKLTRIPVGGNRVCMDGCCCCGGVPNCACDEEHPGRCCSFKWTKRLDDLGDHIGGPKLEYMQVLKHYYKYVNSERAIPSQHGDQLELESAEDYGPTFSTLDPRAGDVEDQLPDHSMAIEIDGEEEPTWCQEELVEEQSPRTLTDLNDTIPVADDEKEPGTRATVLAPATVPSRGAPNNRIPETALQVNSMQQLLATSMRRLTETSKLPKAIDAAMAIVMNKKADDDSRYLKQDKSGTLRSLASLRPPESILDKNNSTGISPEVAYRFIELATMLTNEGDSYKQNELVDGLFEMLVRKWQRTVSKIQSTSIREYKRQ